MLSGQQVRINGDGEQTRDFVHVSDCARANLLAISSEQNGIFNIGSSIGTSINQIFAVLKDLTDYQLEPIYGPAILGETREIYLDATKANRKLKWQPEMTLRKGLESTVAYFSEKEIEKGETD